MHLSPLSASAGYDSVFVDWLFNVPPIVCVGLCFNMHCFVSFLIFVIILTRKRELVDLLYCLSDVLLVVMDDTLGTSPEYHPLLLLLLLIFCGSSLRCRGLVCSIVVSLDQTHLLFEGH